LNLEELPKSTLIEMIERLQAGESLDDLTLPWMYGLADLFHTTRCTDEHDPCGCQYYIENSMGDPWLGKTHRRWLDDVKKKCKEFGILNLTQHEQDVVRVAFRLHTETKNVSSVVADLIKCEILG
jgi:hypothetical protein